METIDIDVDNDILAVLRHVYLLFSPSETCPFDIRSVSIPGYFISGLC